MLKCFSFEVTSDEKLRADTIPGEPCAYSCPDHTILLMWTLLETSFAFYRDKPRNLEFWLWTLDSFYGLRMTNCLLDHSLKLRLFKHFFDYVLLEPWTWSKFSFPFLLDFGLCWAWTWDLDSGLSIKVFTNLEEQASCQRCDIKICHSHQLSLSACTSVDHQSEP